jgi:uncharacterized membrane protein
MTPQDSKTPAQNATPPAVILPAPTPWPIALAFGVTMLLAGLVTNVSISILGAIVFIAACIGWFRDVLPVEQHEALEVEPGVVTIATTRHKVERLAVAPDLPRALLPLETYPISAGIKGGLAGSVAMAVLACLYGIVKAGSIWYPINLLAASADLPSLRSGMASFNSFHLDAFLLACVIHLSTSLLVGVLYGAMLPMVPRHPIFLGGVIAPIMWTGLLHSILDLLNPILDKQINWWWFAVSQFGFGIVAGLIVARQTRMRTHQFMPFLVRAGIEAPGISAEKSGREEGPR